MAASTYQCDTTLPQAAVTVYGPGMNRPAVSELGQLGGWCHDVLHVGAEVDEQGDSLPDAVTAPRP